MYRSCFLLVLSLLICGCSSEPSPVVEVEEPEPIHPVSVVIVDAPNVASDIARQWAARRNGEATIESITLEQLLADDFAVIDDYDVLIHPSSALGSLVQAEKIVAVPDAIWNSEELDSRGMLRDARTHQVKLDGKHWGVPLGSPSFFLMCRSDFLESVGEQAPRSWPEFFALSEKAASQSLTDVEGKTIPNQTLIPTQGRYAADTFFALAAASVRQRGKIDFVFERDTMKPLIDTQPYIMTLQAMKRVFGGRSKHLTPEQVARSLYSAQAGMVVSWPAKGFFLDDDDLLIEELFDRVSVHALPGAERWYDFNTEKWTIRDSALTVNNIGFDGYQASILATANYPTTVYEFLSWLGSKQTASTIWSQSLRGAPSRESHLGNPPNWTGEVLIVEESERYGDTIRNINNQSVYLTFPRIPGANEYLMVLADQIRDFLDKEDADAQTCLQAVAQEWEAITNRRGRDEQIQRMRMDFRL